MIGHSTTFIGTMVTFGSTECVAMYNYAGEAGDLSFSEGDVIGVTMAEGDWWEGTCRGNAGTFPANYVKKREAKLEVS